MLAGTVPIFLAPVDCRAAVAIGSGPAAFWRCG
jgi:hypothetical protein